MTNFQFSEVHLSIVIIAFSWFMFNHWLGAIMNQVKTARSRLAMNRASIMGVIALLAANLFVPLHSLWVAAVWCILCGFIPKDMA